VVEHRTEHRTDRTDTWTSLGHTADHSFSGVVFTVGWPSSNVVVQRGWVARGTTVRLAQVSRSRLWAAELAVCPRITHAGRSVVWARRLQAGLSSRQQAGSGQLGAPVKRQMGGAGGGDVQAIGLLGRANGGRGSWLRQDARRGSLRRAEYAPSARHTSVREVAASFGPRLSGPCRVAPVGGINPESWILNPESCPAPRTGARFLPPLRLVEVLKHRVEHVLLAQSASIVPAGRLSERHRPTKAARVRCCYDWALGIPSPARVLHSGPSGLARRRDTCRCSPRSSPSAPRTRRCPPPG